MNILITGGAGLIGSNLLKALLNKSNNNIFVVDNLWRGKLENISFLKNDNFNLDENFHNLDLKIYKNCLEATKNIDHVIHLADVVSGINYVFENEFSLFQSNLKINSNVLQACISNNVSNRVRPLIFSKVLGDSAVILRILFPCPAAIMTSFNRSYSS